MIFSDDMNLTPEFIKEEPVEVVMDNPLSHKSKQRYLKSYDDFMKWRVEKKVKSLSENVLLIYFNELSKTYKPSTLWSVYSMLKTTLSTKHNVFLKDFERLTSFLKRKSDGFKSKKSKVFTSQEVETFLNQAPDEIYLVMKVVMILGISGACRSIELVNMTVDDIEKQGDILLVNLRGTKTKDDRTFLIKKEFVNIIEKYLNLRPSGMESNRFFINYHEGKCLRQVIGKNKFSSIPKEIATYLNLPNPDLYSGHCFRRTSATLLADSGADLTVIKRHGVAEVYIEESVENKSMTPHEETEMINLHSTDSPQPSTSKDYPAHSINISVKTEENRETSMSPTFTQESLDNLEARVSQKISNINIPGKNMSLTITNCSNFNIYFK